MPKQTLRDKKINEIAKKVLFIDTLESRNVGSLDFHEHSVWQIKEALEQAYEAGKEFGRNKTLNAGR